MGGAEMEGSDWIDDDDHGHDVTVMEQCVEIGHSLGFAAPSV
jgi:hypothetical protein